MKYFLRDISTFAWAHASNANNSLKYCLHENNIVLSPKNPCNSFAASGEHCVIMGYPNLNGFQCYFNIQIKCTSQFGQQKIESIFLSHKAFDNVQRTVSGFNSFKFFLATTSDAGDTKGRAWGRLQQLK